MTAKDLDTVLARGPALPDDLLELTRFVAEYYLCGWGEAIVQISRAQLP